MPHIYHEQAHISPWLLVCAYSNDLFIYVTDAVSTNQPINQSPIIFSVVGFASYLTIYNVLDWPAGVVPVTEVTQQDIDRLQDYHTGDEIEDFVRKVIITTIPVIGT